MTEERCPPYRRRGFTLIEVIGALVIFSLGVLMVLEFSATMGRQMEWAAKSGAVVVTAHERLDSLESLPFDSLSLGVTADQVTIQGTAYDRTVTITSVTAMLYQIDIALAPAGSGWGPSYGATTYSAASW